MSVDKPNYSDFIDLRGLESFSIIYNEDEQKVATCVNNVFQFMLRFSFSRELSSNLNWTQLILSLPPFLTHFMANSPVATITMKNILKAISKLVGVKIFRINRKKEELLSVESAITMIFMKSHHCRNLNLSMDQFILRYPEYNSTTISTAERANLLEFCNCVRVIQCLIPPHNNKEHILDLASRLTEGYTIRRVTGTGMTQETARRYAIIHIEGNLKIRPRTYPEKKTEALSAAEAIVDNDDSATVITAVELDSDSDSDADIVSLSSSEDRKRSRDDDFSPSKKMKSDQDEDTEKEARDGLLLLLQSI